MQQSASDYLLINGLRYHVRRWGNPKAPTVILAHGWLDASASFQFLVDELQDEWNLIAPDWRGFGESAWSNDPYWFPYYLADLDQLLRELVSADEKVHMVGSSLGGNIVSCYAGIRPERVASVVSLEGFGVIDEPASKAPKKIGKWLDELIAAEPHTEYADFAALTARIIKQYPLIPEDRAAFMARHWGEQVADKVIIRADPKHKLPTPRPYRLDEFQAVMESIQAPMLWLEGADSNFSKFFAHDAYQTRQAWFTQFSHQQIQDAGHLLHVDQPKQVANAVEKHLMQAQQAK